KAIGAALEYARWVASHIKRSDEGREVVPGRFGAMPEVRTMLEWQLSADNRSIEAFSVIGAHINLIYWIDREWLKTNSSKLIDLRALPDGQPSREGWAAWNAFLVWSTPHFEFYRLLKTQFGHAVEESSKVTVTEDSRYDPMSHLGEYLMLLY